MVEIAGGTTTSTKQFVWNKLSRLEERDGSGTTTRKFSKFGQVNSSTAYFYFCDHLGSVRQLADSSGNLISVYNFNPYGEEVSDPNGVDADYRYASLYFHPRSRLQLTSHRAYSASLSTWLSRDPAESDMNLYRYGGNNPMKFIDPLGLYVEVTDDPKNKGGTLVRIPITFSGEISNTALLNSYIAGINKYWNPGNLKFGDCKIRFEAFIGSINGNTNKITLVSARQENGTLRNSGVWSIALNAELDGNNPGWSAAHEIGHTLGLWDNENPSKIMIQPNNRTSFSGSYAQQSDVDTIFQRGNY